MRVLILEFPSNVSMDANYDVINKFYRETNVAMQRELNRAPRGLKHGWFVSDLEMFSLQRALVAGTCYSLLLSLGVAFVVVAASTLNLVVTVLSCLTVASIVTVVMGSMCAMGWQLNVLESVVLSIGVGLSVDFTSHVAIAYLLAPHKGDRKRRVEHVTTKLSGAILCAACTTFIAGLGLVTSSILAYRRFGVFLMLVTSVSWAYSNYFFCGLLAAFGPQNETCPIDGRGTLLCCCCCHGDMGDQESVVSGRRRKIWTDHTTTFLTESSSCPGGPLPLSGVLAGSSSRGIPCHGNSSHSTLARSSVAQSGQHNFEVVEKSTLI